MRPLSPALKTALIFYSAFALILVTFHFWPAQPVTLPAAVGAPSLVFEQSGPVDLVFLQDSLDESWTNLLQRNGWQLNEVLQWEEARLHERETDRNRLRWVRSRSRIQLPPAANEHDLVELGWEWRKLVSSQGLAIRAIRWGFNGRTLWIRCESVIPVTLSGAYQELPAMELLLKQPLTGAVKRSWQWRGLIPEPPPFTRPAPTPVAIQPQPTAAPAPTVAAERPPAPPQPLLTAKPAPVPTVKPSPVPTLRPQIPPVRRRARVAIIIDDVGFVRAPADAMLQVPARLTWSVLPFTPYALEYIGKAKERGFEIMLHLPLEPLNKAANPGPGLIRREWPEEQILTQLDADIKQVPGLAGINNHMGSAGTYDDRLMDILLKAIKERQLFFIDSNTGDPAHPSVAAKYARKYNVPFAKRRVFIDDSSDYQAKLAALRQLLKLALKEGEAIGIGHVRSGTPEAIIEVLPEFIKAGVAIVPASELVR